MIDKEIIMKLAKQAGMNFTPAQFSGVLEDEIDEFELEEFTKLVEEYIQGKYIEFFKLNDSSLFWGSQIVSCIEELNPTSQKLYAELQEWKNVFGYLLTPNQYNLERIKLIEQRDSLLKALVKIYNWDSHSRELAVDYGSNGVRDFYRKIAQTEIEKHKY